MATDVFEGSVVTLHGEDPSGIATTGTFTVMIGSKEIGSFTETLDADGRATKTYRLPLMPRDKDTYQFGYFFSAGDRSIEGNADYMVWRKRVVLRALDVDKSLQPFPRFKVLVKQDGGIEEKVTIVGSGTFEWVCKKPAAVTVEAVAPGVIKEWNSETGLVREFQAEKKFEAEFVKPEAPADGKPIEQYVNRASTKKGRDKKGHEVTFLVAPKGDSKKAAADRVGLEGDEIFIKVTFDKKTKRSTPKPALLGAEDIVEVDPGKVFTGKAKIRANSEPAEFKVELGYSGLDTCEVKIGSTDAVADATIKFENWRHIYYQVTIRKGLALPSLTRITNALAKAGIKYERYKKLEFEETDTGMPAGSFFDGAVLGKAGRIVNVGDHNKAYFHGKFTDTHNPVGAHVVICDAQYDGGRSALTAPVSVEVQKSDAKVKFPLGSGTQVCGHVQGIRAIKRGANVFPVAMQDGKFAVRDAKWKSLAAAGEHKDKHGTIPNDHFSIDFKDHANKVACKLPAAGAAVVEADETVKISYKVLYCKGAYLGESDGKKPHWQLVVNMVESSTNDVLAHELGHTLKQVVKVPPPGFTLADHGFRYTSRGHQGPHCGFGETAAYIGDASKTMKGRAKCKCIHYGENSSKGSVSSGKFCEKCLPFLQAEQMTNITKK